MFTLKKRIFCISSIFYIGYVLFPLIASISGVPIQVPSIIVFVLLLFLFPNAFFNKTFFWFLVYMFVLFFYIICKKPLTVGIGTVADTKKFVIEAAFILPALSIGLVLHYLEDEKLYRIISRWSVLLLYLSFLYILPILLANTNILRMPEDKIDQDMVGSVSLLPSYSLMHAYVFGLPPICYAYKCIHSRSRWLILGMVLLHVYVIIQTYVTTSLAIVFPFLLIFFLYSERYRSFTFLMFIFLFAILYILFQAGVFISLIDFLFPYFQGTPVESKLIDIKASMMVGELQGGTIDVRQNLHDISWNSFFQNPLWGTSIVGRHSSLIDRLGGMGLFAFIPFVMIIISFFRQIVKLVDESLAKLFLISGLIIIGLFLYMKGLFGFEGWLFLLVFLPTVIIDVERNFKEK